MIAPIHNTRIQHLNTTWPHHPSPIVFSHQQPKNDPDPTNPSAASLSSLPYPFVREHERRTGNVLEIVEVGQSCCSLVLHQRFRRTPSIFFENPLGIGTNFSYSTLSLNFVWNSNWNPHVLSRISPISTLIFPYIIPLPSLFLRISKFGAKISLLTTSKSQSFGPEFLFVASESLVGGCWSPFQARYRPRRSLKNVILLSFVFIL